MLNEKIHKDEQEQILQALANYTEAVKAAYPNGSDAEVLNRARDMYRQQFGVDLIDDIRANGKDAFTQGFVQAVTFGLADNKTAEENIADITGQSVGRGDQTKKILGRAAGGAVVGGAATYLLSFSKYFKEIVHIQANNNITIIHASLPTALYIVICAPLTVPSI